MTIISHCEELRGNRHHSTIKYTAEISDKDANFLDTTVYKGKRFHNQGIPDIRTHFRLTIFNTRISLPVTLTGSEKVS